jgi:hypothetical protein
MRTGAFSPLTTAAFFHWHSETISIILQLAFMPVAGAAMQLVCMRKLAKWARAHPRDSPPPAREFEISFAAQSSVISKMYDDESRPVVTYVATATREGGIPQLGAGMEYKD